MFGFSLATQLFQGSAQRTWNRVTQFTNLLWYKYKHYRYPAMPRSRRRHHSRSRSRSRSHSPDRDRDAKRRKIDNVDSPAQKRSVSSQPHSPQTSEEKNVEENQPMEERSVTNVEEKPISEREESDESDDDDEKQNSDADESIKESAKSEKPMKQIEEKLTITPKKTLSPKDIQKKLESEKKRQQKQQEREERERKRQEEKERQRLEREQQKKEKEELKNKKNEQKRKEREEKEAKRKEKEEREEAKRKEREQEKLKKQQELEEKNREKQKIEGQKQKAAQAFVNFFVAKKTETKTEEPKMKLFMPFEVKSDMRLAPKMRKSLTDEERSLLTEILNKGESTYLKELKQRKRKKCYKTWPYEEDVIIMEEDFGESICEDKQKLQKMRVKFLKFHENKRPPYYGTWRKKSVSIKPKKPLVEDKSFFDYEVDSDDDWEEEQGESLENGSDDEEKENEAENEDYEVDNEFFVPHGHLSDDEVDDEELAKLSPESHKQKLKLLKDEFDQDMKAKTNRMKPRSIGCIWYNKDRSNVDDAIDRHLRPLAIITNGRIILKKRKGLVPNTNTPSRKNLKELQQDLIPVFLKMISGNTNKKTTIVEEFLNYMRNNGFVVEVSKAYLQKFIKQNAQWKKCAEEGAMFNKFCWCLEDEAKKKCSFK